MCLLRLKPQDIPASPALLKATLTLYLGANIAVSLIGSSVVEALIFGTLGTLLEIAFTIAALYVRGCPARITQTLTALVGTGILTSIPACLLRYWFSVLQARDLDPELAVNVWILVFVWRLFIIAHILRHALNTRLIFGFLIAVGYVFVLFQCLVLMQLALGPPGA
jgi:hypothetical protein